MKKKILNVVLCITMSAMVFTFSACGDKKEETTDNDTEVEATVEPTEEAEDETDDDAAADETEAQDDGEDTSSYKMFDSVEEFAESDLIQDQLTGLKESLAEGGMDINITGEDNKLIYTFSYLEITKVDGMAEAIDQQLASQEDNFKAVAKSIKAAVEVENPVVVVTYVDANGDEILTKEYEAE